MSSHVEQIKERLSITDVVGSYMKLEKVGGNAKGKCPFHNEKTPSFFLSPARGTYYCFGCGAKGDIFSFVQEFEGLDFMGALRVLAERAGVALVKERPEARTEREQLFRCLESAASFFQRTLYENAGGKYKDVVEYLLKRGLNKETIKDWRIGYAPGEWRALRDYLLGRGFTDVQMEKVGLIKRKSAGDEDAAAPAGAAASGGQGYYDRFRARIMFPIFDSSGRVIAFTGRVFPDDEKSAKYLNSPETEFFNKSETLYGFDRAKHVIREKDCAVLVEGQMDLIMVHQAGYANVVASSGTALTAQHLDRVRKLAKSVIFAFDPDGAGEKAAVRSAEIALGMGLEVKIAELPKGKDPADFVRENKDAWGEVMARAVHVIEFALNRAVAGGHDPRALAKVMLEKVLPFIARLESTMEKSHFVKMVNAKTGLREDAIWDDVRMLEKKLAAAPAVAVNSAAAQGRPTGQSERGPTALASPARVGRPGLPERALMGMYFSKAVNQDDIRAKAGTITGEGYFAELLEKYGAEEAELALEAEVTYEKSERIAEAYKDVIQRFEEEYLKERFADTLRELTKAEKAGIDKEKVAELVAVCKTLSDRIAVVTKRAI